MNTPTPRTDTEHAQFPMGGFTLDFARQLERELTEAREELKETKKHLKDANRGAEINAHALRINADKLISVTEQREDFKKELEIANLRLKGKRHPDDNGIMADGEIDIKALIESNDTLSKDRKRWRKIAIYNGLQSDRLAEALLELRNNESMSIGSAAYEIIEQALQSLNQPKQ